MGNYMFTRGKHTFTQQLKQTETKKQERLNKRLERQQKRQKKGEPNEIKGKYGSGRGGIWPLAGRLRLRLDESGGCQY